MGNSVSNNNSNDFIIKYNQSAANNSCIDDIDKRRVIFISLIGLFETWDNCPSHILYSSIFLLPLKTSWIYHPKKYKKEINKTFIAKYSNFSYNSVRNKKFIELLKWKDSQKLLFCMLDNYGVMDNNHDLIHPFWYFLSSKLIHLYDPVSNNKYKPLTLNINWWKNTYNKTKNASSMYNVNIISLESELYFRTMKYKSIQEILYQSNCNSFNIIINYHKYSNNNNLIKSFIKTHTISNNITKNTKNHNEWYISDDYYTSS